MKREETCSCSDEWHYGHDSLVFSDLVLVADECVGAGLFPQFPAGATEGL